LSPFFTVPAIVVSTPLVWLLVVIVAVGVALAVLVVPFVVLFTSPDPITAPVCVQPQSEIESAKMTAKPSNLVKSIGNT